MRRYGARFLAIVLSVSVVFAPALPASAQAARAGEVAARIPDASVSRPGQVLVADVGLPVEWNDLVETAARGRVRITLGDGSTLNVGSDSSLRVVQHNQQSRETDLTLGFGKMRSRLQRLSPGQHFEIRTNTAVVGVVGTDFFLEATATMTRVIVYEGMVLVRNINPSVAGEKRVAAGSTVLIYAGQPPFDPQPSEPAEVQQSVDDTAVGEELPGPPSRPGTVQRLGRKKWFWIVAVATAATLAIAIPLATGGTDATGCSVPEPSCPP
jgi:ferric-dicitrate binding protein FerR (iron transport regulator)